MMNLNSSAIKSVTYYQASGPVETCDRCGQGIRHVAAVIYKDDTRQRYGMDCINKVLEARPDLRKLFTKNMKLLKLYRDYSAILSGPVDQMPRGSEYYGSGKYFIADSEGNDIAFGHCFFHPTMDLEKNAARAGKNYYSAEPAAWSAKQIAENNADLPKLAARIANLEAFLAKVLRSCPQPTIAS